MNEPITEQQLTEWEALAKEAPPGPWLEREEDDYYLYGTYLYAEPAGDICRVEDVRAQGLIEAAPVAMPALLAEVRRLRERLYVLTGSTEP